MKLTLLGTGTSFGVPQIGCDCAVCRSADPRDKRNRTGALIETAGATILIDMPQELRLGLLAARATRLDAVLVTHSHADHVAGIDDLRMFSVRQRVKLPIHTNAETAAFLARSYQYIFDDEVIPPKGTSKPRLGLTVVTPGTPFSVGDVEILPLGFGHGDLEVLGFRIGKLGYLTDVKAIGPAGIDALRGTEVVVMNALWWRPHPTHQSIPEAVEAARAIGARRTILTHLTHETGHAELAAALPAGVEPGYDGLTVEIAE